MKEQELNRLLEVLVAQPKESEWLEFKHNFHSEKEIGERLSALSNSACLYQHTCLRYVSNEQTTNQSLRTRFQIEDKNYPMISRLLKDAVDASLIKLANPEEKSPRNRKYVPYWG